MLIRFSGASWDEFTTVILDDGTGFRTKNDLFRPFNLAIQDVQENQLGKKKLYRKHGHRNETDAPFLLRFNNGYHQI